MNPMIENMTKYIPPHNTGYEYAKHIWVYIPIKEVGLEILERRTQQLPFLYETILKLLKLGVKDVNQTADMLGLDENTYSEIISQMGIADLLFVSGTTMMLTNKGAEALADLKKITIKKTYMNQVYVNLVTGDILNDEPRQLDKTPIPSCMCLDQTINLDIGFFRDHFRQLNELYQINTADELKLDDKTRTDPDSIDRELYRILDIDYENTMYQKLSCFVFVHPENGDLLLSFEGDRDSRYLSVAMAQIREGLTGAMKIFSGFQKTSTILEMDEAKQSALDNLIYILRQRGKTRVSTLEIEDKYYKDRYLLFGETEELLANCGTFKPKTIFISASSIKTMMESPDIVSAITASNIERLVLVYNGHEYGVDQSISWIRKKIKGKNPKLECYPQPRESSVEENWTIVFPGFAIFTHYEQLPTNYDARVIQRGISDITFSPSTMSTIIDKLCQTYGIINP